MHSSTCLCVVYMNDDWPAGARLSALCFCPTRRRLMWATVVLFLFLLNLGSFYSHFVQ